VRAGIAVDVDVGVDAAVEPLDRLEVRLDHSPRLDLLADLAGGRPPGLAQSSSCTPRMIVSKRSAAVERPKPSTPWRLNVSSAESDVIRIPDQGTPF